MTLTTHAIVGAAVASFVPAHPVVGFVLGFASHFVLDAIPHWDYRLAGMVEDEHDTMNNDVVIGKDFPKDLLRTGGDAVLGLVLAFFLFGVFKTPPAAWPASSILWGAAGGILPDALQFVYFKWRHWPMTMIQTIHTWFHTKSDLKDRPWIGIPIQIAIIAVAVGAVKLLS